MTRVLVIETATAACSVALLGLGVDAGPVIDQAHDVVGRGHAERLVPMIAALDRGGRCDRILVDCGPGSFTGIRVGLAAARALGFGWQVPVTGYSALALLAVAAFACLPDRDILVATLTGGHGELFVQRFDRRQGPVDAVRSLVPAAAAAYAARDPVVGSGAPALLMARGDDDGIDILPDAADAWRLGDTLSGLPPTPIYGRPPDAKPSA